MVLGKMRPILTLVAVAAVVTATLAVIGVIAVGAQTAPVTVKATVSTENNVAVIDISATNNTDRTLQFYEIIATLPNGTLINVSPSSYEIDGNRIIWESPTRAVGSGKSLVGYQYKVQNASGTIVVNVKYRGPGTSGEASSGPVQVSGAAPAAATAAPGQATPTATPTPEAPRRGCLACHVLVDPATGKYTLGYEAEERAKADYGAEHPVVAPSGAKIDPLTVSSVKACLECHAPSKSDPGRGVGAPITLRDIVHPAHMFSTTFVQRYKGNCFTCHNVRGDGVFELLGDKVDVNDKGVPKELMQGKGSITGSVPPSEGGR